MKSLLSAVKVRVSTSISSHEKTHLYIFFQKSINLSMLSQYKACIATAGLRYRRRVRPSYAGNVLCMQHGRRTVECTVKSTARDEHNNHGRQTLGKLCENIGNSLP